MVSYSVLALLCLILPGADPVTPDELQIAVAALEERFTSRPTMEVVFHTKSEWASGYKDRPLPLPEDATANWLYKDGKQSFFYTSGDGPKKMTLKWVYDGQTTQSWSFESGAKQPRDITIWKGPPPFDLIRQNMLALSLGFSAFGHEEGLAYFLKVAKEQKSLSGSRTDKLIKVKLGQLVVETGESEIFITVDPAHDYRIVSWNLEQWGKNPRILNKYEIVVDEFQSVTDEASKERVWFPLRAHMTSLATIGRLEIASIRINHNLPDGRFAHESPPFGTILREMPIITGGAAKESLVGGEAAHHARIAKLTDQAKQEVARLDEKGVTFDATPQSNAYSHYWWLAGGLLLLVAYLCWMFQRKR